MDRRSWLAERARQPERLGSSRRDAAGLANGEPLAEVATPPRPSSVTSLAFRRRLGLRPLACAASLVTPARPDVDAAAVPASD
jgi:hypothetical protein